jgi:hypothetical protein
VRYTVIWTPAALDDFVALWVPATDRQAVSDSFDRIDSELRSYPEAKGIPFGKKRLYYDDPLAVMDVAYPGDDIVMILALKRIT